MEGGGTMVPSEEWGSYEEAEAKLISMIAERDAAILERDAALAEKKAACAERDAALLQRDVAFADRNNAIMERDAAIAPLEYAKNGTLNVRTELGAKILQVLADSSAFALREGHQNLQPLASTSTAPVSVLEEPKKQINQDCRKKEGYKDNTPKRKSDISTPKNLKPRKQRKLAMEDPDGPLVAVKHEWKDHDDNDIDDDNSGLTIDTSAVPIPACSCTGVLQQCYRWGNGGWQSACCTNNISMYPLPMNPKKKGARVPGRKMSGGAFRKLLTRLSAQGDNLSQPIDLKNHWARHGTNRYVTIR